MDIKSETSTILDLPPSAVAFCPSHPEFYVVGTYFLHPKEEEGNNDKTSNSEDSSSNEAPQKRTGTLILYRLQGSVL
jgi:diphthamide biosynthesis protein 7